MRNLIATSAKTVINHIGVKDYCRYAGLLTSPRTSQHPRHATKIGAVWAMDNNAFTEFKAGAFIRAMQRWHTIPGCQFVVAPDSVGNAQKTLAYFWLWQPVIDAFGMPVALALQNGMEALAMPWDYLDAVFIGGDTLFKYTHYIRDITHEAKRRGKWVHMGRVNSARRIRHCLAIGCDSFDGSGYAIEPIRTKKELHHWKHKNDLPVQYTLFT